MKLLHTALFMALIVTTHAAEPDADQDDGAIPQPVNMEAFDALLTLSLIHILAAPRSFLQRKRR